MVRLQRTLNRKVKKHGFHFWYQKAKYLEEVLRQGAYNSGKPRKLRANSGTFKFTQGILVSVIVGIEFYA